MSENAARRSELFERAVSTILRVLPQTLPRAEAAGRPVIYGADGSPLIPHQTNQYSRRSASLKGSLRTWKPRLLSSDLQFSNERETIVDRACDLVESDAHGAGMVDTIATLVVGTGLNPYPMIDMEATGLEKEAARKLSARARSIWRKWSPWADAGTRNSIDGIGFQLLRNIVQYGEYLCLCHMIKNDPGRPYSLALRLINPTRMFTPTDLNHRTDIKDGVEVGEYGQPVAYWIQRAGVSISSGLSSANFVRIPARAGHRFKVLHGFLGTEPEQVRGISLLSPMMKLFRDSADYIDAELVSNVVTAAMALFIETGAEDPYSVAQRLSSITDEGTKSDGSVYDQRYQEIIPGAVMYGSSGQKPHLLSAQRPSVTFDPFIRNIKKTIAIGAGFPYPVLFRDFDQMSYAGYRSAMLEAWRVVKTRRNWMGGNFYGPVYRMLLEEAYLRGEFEAKDFYTLMHEYTAAQWIGPAKGQIEPEKEAKGDILQIQHNLKSREEVAIEQNRDLRTTFDQLEDEQAEMERRGLDEMKVGEIVEPGLAPDDPGEGGENADN